MRSLAGILLLCAASCGYAGQERYDHDDRGRLIRVTDDQGRVTEYVYDVSGNILQIVRRQGSAQGRSATATPTQRPREAATVATEVNESRRRAEDATATSGAAAPVTTSRAPSTVSDRSATQSPAASEDHPAIRSPNTPVASVRVSPAVPAPANAPTAEPPDTASRVSAVFTTGLPIGDTVQLRITPLSKLRSRSRSPAPQ